MTQAFDSLSERVNWIISILIPRNMTRISEDNKLECWIRKRRSFFGTLDVEVGECVSGVANETFWLKIPELDLRRRNLRFKFYSFVDKFRAFYEPGTRHVFGAR